MPPALAPTMSTSDFTPDHPALPRIRANPGNRNGWSLSFLLQPSARLDHLASGVGDRTRGLLTRNQRGHGEHVVGAGLRRMCLTDEDVGHQFVIAGAVTDFARLQRDIRWELHILKRLRHFRALQRLRLLRRYSYRLSRNITEPVARRGRLLGRGAIVGNELHHFRY